MNDRYVISAYKHDSTLIKAIQNLSLNPGMQLLISSGSGAVDPTFVSGGQIQPEVTFDTLAIKTALANIGGISGDALTSDYFFFQQMVNYALRGGALKHTKITMATGIIIPVSIQASQGGEASISYRIIPTSADGSASPLSVTADQSLDGDQDLVDEVYTLGSIEINGTELEGIETVTIDFGIELHVGIGSGHIYPTFVGVMRRAPSITARTFDLDAFETWLETGVAQGESDSVVNLIDQAQAGVRGSTPITFTIDEAMMIFESIDGTHGQRMGGLVRITPVWDGTAAILVVGGIS